MENNDRVLFGVMNIIFNSVGVPCFMRGNSGEGVKHIIFSIITCGVMGIVYTVKGIIEGIRILNLSDEDYMKEKNAQIGSSNQGTQA